MTEQTSFDRIKEFFHAYESNFRNALAGNEDADAFAAFFANSFVGANPHGVMCSANDAHFRKQIPMGNQHYRDIGTKDMYIREIVTKQLDDFHYMATVFWHSEYERKDSRKVTIDFSVIYLLQDIDDTLKIFGYITGDEQKALKETGLI